MAITTIQDLHAIQDILVADPWLQRQGFTQDNVLTRAAVVGELKDDVQYILIYNMPNNKARRISAVLTYGIDIILTSNKINLATQISEQIHALLHEKEIHTCRTLTASSMFGMVSSAEEIIVINGTFETQATLYTELKT